MVWSYLSRTVPRLRNFLKEHDVDIVHTNDGRIHASWVLPTFLSSAKLLWHHRGSPEAKGINILAPLFAKHIVSVSRFATPSNPIVQVSRKLSILHSPFEHPVDPPDRNREHDRLAYELGCAMETRFLGFFGSLIDRKRPILFVDVLNAYISKYPNIPVAGVIFGEVERGRPRLDTAVLERAKELGINDRIHLMGFRKPVEPWMTAVDILLVPAIDEPFGRTLIEAMLLGTPVIATNHGGNPEAIRHGVNGFLVEPDKPEAFIAPLHQLLTEPSTWRRISETARTEAMSRYGIDVHVKKMMEIYETMMQRDTH